MRTPVLLPLASIGQTCRSAYNHGLCNDTHARKTTSHTVYGRRVRPAWAVPHRHQCVPIHARTPKRVRTQRLLVFRPPVRALTSRACAPCAGRVAAQAAVVCAGRHVPRWSMATFESRSASLFRARGTWSPVAGLASAPPFSSNPCPCPRPLAAPRHVPTSSPRGCSGRVVEGMAGKPPRAKQPHRYGRRGRINAVQALPCCGLA